mmetsp:Transcript_29018/g.43864  ORF Transcript_29018/g.43864 Transcript_29018/m.43864 type:complete len:470 (+) Transcript_29018:80-1489(+)
MLSEVQLESSHDDDVQQQQQEQQQHWPKKSSSAESAIMPRVNKARAATLKRPRRKVVKRTIDSLPLTEEEAGDDTELLLGFSVKQRKSGHHLSRDPHRAPKVALAFFLLVCSIGGYQGFNEYWSNRAILSPSSAISNEEADASEEAFDLEHRETLLHVPTSETDISNIEDTPVVLFNENIEVPWQLSGLANVFEEPYDPEKNKLYLWTIPRCGSTSIRRIASHCLGLTMASEAGKGDVGGDSLQVVEGNGMKYVNVDMSNPNGIAHAKELGVGGWSKVDMVSSSYLYDGAGIFDPDHKGYMIAMFRHPIERAVSLFYNLKSNKAYAEQMVTLSTVEQYSRSSLVENNWMTRFLSNSLSGELTPEHEAIAKEVLRTKCIIGLLQEKAESMRRLEMLFDVKAEKSQRRYDCQEKLWYWDWPGKNRHEQVLEGSEAWNRLYEQNSFDIRLYEYARELFKAQGKLFQTSVTEE